MTFVPGKTVDYYLGNGWKILPPTRSVCRTCGTALLCHENCPFVYCVDCREKIDLHEKTAPPITNDLTDTEKASLSQESYENKGVHQSTSQSPSTLLGDLLLRGYAMSSLSCPNNCNIPLARDPSNQSTVICASCGFKSSDESFMEPQAQIDSKEIARQISHKVNLIANNYQKNIESNDLWRDNTKIIEQKEPTDISIAYIAESLRDKLSLLGKELAEIPIDPLNLTTNTCQQISSLVSAMRDIQDARKILLENLAF